MEISWKKLVKQLLLKFFTCFYRLVDVFRFLPLRIARVFEHGQKGLNCFWRNNMQTLFRSQTINGIAYWWLEFFLLLLDCIGISELAETIADFFKFNSRPLYAWEKKLAYSIFGDTIQYDRVRIDEFALIGPRQQSFCYVSFFMINSWGSMHNSVLLHELVHVWQYQHMGIVYIPRALHAQGTQQGYNYGGVENLKACWRAGKGLKDFNLEQQADIIMDYYRIKNGYAPQWGRATMADLSCYENYVNQLKQ